MNILVVAAHPDDELLGVGGTIRRHTSNGDRVDILIVGEGFTSRNADAGSLDSSRVSELKSCARSAAELLKANEPEFLNLPDNRLDSINLLDIIKPIERVIGKVNPEVIYTHHSGDLNIDHRIVNNAVRTAARPLPNSPVKTLYCFETLSSTEWGTDEFLPQRFVDIENVLPDKLRALSFYKQEMRAVPHARSLQAVEALAKMRGASVGMVAAEAFSVVMDLLRA